MIAAHYDAVRARLLADAALASKGVNDTALVDAGGLPVKGTYTILFGGAPDLLDDDRFTAPQLADSDAEFTYTVRSVSPSAAGVRATQSRVSAQLTGFAPVVAGRSCGRMVLTRTTEPRPDFTVSPPLFWGDQRYELRSSRA